MLVKANDAGSQWLVAGSLGDLYLSLAVICGVELGEIFENRLKGRIEHGLSMIILDSHYHDLKLLIFETS